MHQLIPFEPLDIELSISVNLAWQADKIIIDFELIGDLNRLDLAEVTTEKNRVIGLWESTCFELFIKAIDSDEYLEFNFSPSGDWNCFYFTHYRSELTQYTAISSSDIEISVHQRQGQYQQNIQINTAQFPSCLQQAEQSKIGLNAVLKTGDSLSYWALYHPRYQADFHDELGFIL